jgi:hypothetical protein
METPLARTPGATNKTEREHRKDAALSTEKAKNARLKAENKSLKADVKAAKKQAKKA